MRRRALLTIAGAVLAAGCPGDGGDATPTGTPLSDHPTGASAGMTGTGAAGLVAGMLGAGRPTCGQALLVGLLSLFGATSVLGAFRLGGTELPLVAFLPVVVSVHWFARGLQTPDESCPG